MFYVVTILLCGQDLLDLRREPARPEPSRVLDLLRQEDEGRARPELPTSLEPFPEAPLGMSNVGYGPLRLASQSPMNLLRLEPAVGAPSSLAPGTWELKESLTWSRMWAQAENYLLSFETLGQSTSFAYGVNDRLQVELGAVATTRFAGDLEGFVKNFHDTFGLEQGGRDTVREGDFEFQIGDVELQEGPRHESSDRVFASLHYTLTEGSDVLPAVAATITVATGIGDSPDLRGDTATLSGQLSVAKRWGDFYGYLGFGLAWFGRDSFYGLPLKPFGASVLTGVEWRFTRGASLVFQHLWTPGALEGFEELSRPAYELGLGLKVEICAGSVIELGLTENILVFDSSPDFGLHAGMSLRF